MNSGKEKWLKVVVRVKAVGCRQNLGRKGEQNGSWGIILGRQRVYRDREAYGEEGETILVDPAQVPLWKWSGKETFAMI